MKRGKRRRNMCPVSKYKEESKCKVQHTEEVQHLCINIKRIQPEYISHRLTSQHLNEMVIASPPDPSASTWYMPAGHLRRLPQVDCTFGWGQVVSRRGQRSEHIQLWTNQSQAVLSSPQWGHKFSHQGPLMCTRTGRSFKSSSTIWFAISQVPRFRQWWKWRQRTSVYVLGLVLPSYENFHLTAKWRWKVLMNCGCQKVRTCLAAAVTGLKVIGRSGDLREKEPWEPQEQSTFVCLFSCWLKERRGGASDVLIMINLYVVSRFGEHIGVETE